MLEVQIKLPGNPQDKMLGFQIPQELLSEEVANAVGGLVGSLLKSAAKNLGEPKAETAKPEAPGAEALKPGAETPQAEPKAAKLETPGAEATQTDPDKKGTVAEAFSPKQREQIAQRHPWMDDWAQKSSNFEAFVRNVLSQVNIKEEKQNLLFDVIMYAKDLPPETLTWTNLKSHTRIKTADYQAFSNAVTRLGKDLVPSFRFMEFIRLVCSYKNNEFFGKTTKTEKHSHFDAIPGFLESVEQVFTSTEGVSAQEFAIQVFQKMEAYQNYPVMQKNAIKELIRKAMALPEITEDAVEKVYQTKTDFILAKGYFTAFLKTACPEEWKLNAIQALQELKEVLQ